MINGHGVVFVRCFVTKELDLHTCTLEDTKGLEATAFSFPLKNGAPPVTGFAGWFDVSFRGRDGVAPLASPIEFSTSPAAGYTHWGQQARARARARRSVYFFSAFGVVARVGFGLL